MKVYEFEVFQEKENSEIPCVFENLPPYRS